MQPPPFCKPKTILLHCKNHAFVLRICNVHRMNTLQTFREYPHSPTKTPNLHTARRRGPIHRARIFPLPNPYFHIIKYVYSFHRKHISVRHFVDIYGYEGTINRSPTAANGLLITLLTDWNNMANTLQNIHIQSRNSQRTICNYTTFKKQKLYFCFP